MSPLAGLSSKRPNPPSAVALGHIMAALTGLAAADTETLAY
jgi:hypothetical protein